MIQFIALLFPSSKKLTIWSFHVIVVQGGQRNVQKSVITCRVVVFLTYCFLAFPLPLRHATGTGEKRQPLISQFTSLPYNKTRRRDHFRPAWRLEHEYRVCHNSHKKGERGYTGDGHLDQFYLVPFWSFLHNFHLLDRGFSMSFLNTVQLPYHFVKFTNRKLSRISAP